MKPGLLCLLLLGGCWTLDDPTPVYNYALTWTCLSPEGCERTDEVERIDRMQRVTRDCHFTSTEDESFNADAKLVISDFLPRHCLWVYLLSLFDQELPPSEFCFVVGGFEWELAIPNADSSTFSMWLVEGRDVSLL